MPWTKKSGASVPPKGWQQHDPHRTLWKVAPMTQLEKLDALISSATAAREDARRGRLFDGLSGLVLLNAAYDLLESYMRASTDTGAHAVRHQKDNR